ncbi:MAG: ATP-dependent 6-phosphofructokinase [Spirochaetales bacterium]|nr:ATP-dependent 6-phosphofructokinase [Spirochaetales bacterium]
MEKIDFTVETLGPCKIESPIPLKKNMDEAHASFVNDNERVLYDIIYHEGSKDNRVDYVKNNLMEKAGPRKQIYFQPNHVHAGIITCGGLCPGLNDVIRAIVRSLWNEYGVRRITGIRYGYQGLDPNNNLPFKELNPEIVDEIHTKGGTILGSSRGGPSIETRVDTIERLNLNMLFVIGGDGTQHGALYIAEEIKRRGLKISIIGVPKTIDNDINYMQKSFGFETAVAEAVNAVYAAHTEAKGAIDGIGLVKVMGRESGFIAAHTALATNDANFVLVPEVKFELEGPNGLLAAIDTRLENKFHAVILVAEGAGQDLLESSTDTDASGNKKLGDIGPFLAAKIIEHRKKIGKPANLKYIDPSYMIRAAAATPNDSLYCSRLGTNAVHAAMAGKTKILISMWNYHLVHVPIELAISERKVLDPKGPLWRDVLSTTRMPLSMTNN